MGEHTGIEWAHHTLNLWVGCSKVNKLCQNCYAERSTFAKVRRADGIELWGAKADRRLVSEKTVNQVYRWNQAALEDGERRRVFCSSLSDILEDRRDLDRPRFNLWKIVEDCQGLNFLLLSKRPENFARFTPRSWRDGSWPSNAWAGTSAGDQETAEDAIPKLIDAARMAPVLFVSIEPMVGPIDFSAIRIHDDELGARWRVLEDALSWVIVGGESGPDARPMHPDWPRSIRDQCVDAGVPFFFKQWGGWSAVYDRDVDDPDWGRCDVVRDSTPRGRWLNLSGGHGFHGDRVVRVDRIGKKAAGRELDGRTWDQTP